ncbi:MAG TPA: DUF2059 domain-containing protein [Sphingomicrobium sp.]|jgi:hypothetical protein
MRRWLLLPIAALVSGPIAAQEVPHEGPPPPIAPPEPPTPRPKPSPEHLRLGQQLAGLIVDSEIHEEVIHTPPPKPHTGRIVARPTARWNVASAAAETYAELYSMDELKAMIAFFESPAGQKYLSARRDGVVRVMHIFRQLPWYTDLYHEACGGQEFCRWKPGQ